MSRGVVAKALEGLAEGSAIFLVEGVMGFWAVNGDGDDGTVLFVVDRHWMILPFRHVMYYATDGALGDADGIMGKEREGVRRNDSWR